MATTEPTFNSKQVILKNLYRNGKKVPMMFRNGELIYRMLQKLVFEVDTTPIEFLPSGGTQTITITANDDWVMTLPAWLTASSISGTSSTIVTITATQQSEKLTGDITITCGDEEAVIEVVQGEIDYSKEYFTIEALETGNFIVRKNMVGVSINGGEWEPITSTPYNIPLDAGDRVRFKSTSGDHSGIFSGNTIQFKVYGNIQSLRYEDNFENNTTATRMTNIFRSSTGLIDASNLVLPGASFNDMSSAYTGSFYGCSNMTDGPAVLPATALYSSSYRQMFAGCSKLKKSPDIMATSASWSRALSEMFSGCTSLEYVKCLLTSASGSNVLTGWMTGVQTTEGTFVKHPNATFWSRGVNGIPTNWTVEDADI